MSEIMRKIEYYENLLEIKEITNTKLDLDEVNNGMLCRTCLKDANDDVDLESICVMDVQEGNFLKVRDVLINLAKGVISDHGHDLPLKICRECLNKIKTFYYFTIQLRKAENVLQRLGLKLKKDKIEDSTDGNKQDTITSQGFGSTADDATNKVELSDDELMNAVEYLKNYQTPVELCHENQNSFKEEPELNISDINEEFYSDSDITQVENDAKNSKTIQIAGEQLNINCINDTNKHDFVSKGDEFERLKSTQTIVSNYMEMLDTQCAVCKQNFTIVEKLINHVKQCHPNARAFKCRNCSKVLFLNFVYRHYRNVHPTIKLTQERVEYFDNKCAVCQKIFFHRADLVSHCRQHHPKDKAFKCRNCTMHFSHMSSLRRHYRSDHEKTLIRKKHACKICSQSCYSEADLKIHLRIHTGERPYSCPLCDWTFNMKGSLMGHLKTHEDCEPLERSHTCEICSRRFKRLSYLREHLLTHNEGRPYSCSFCEKDFKTRKYMIRHELTHAKRKSKLNFKEKRLHRCSLCERSFRDKSNWEIHEMTHAKRKFIFCKKKLNREIDANKESYLSVVEKNLANIGDTENVQCFSENYNLSCDSVKSLEIEKDSQYSKKIFLSKTVEKHKERRLESEFSLEIDNGKIISIQSCLNKNNELNLKSKGDNVESDTQESLEIENIRDVFKVHKHKTSPSINNITDTNMKSISYKEDQSKKSAKIKNNFRDFKIKKSILNANKDSTVHKDCNKNYEPTAIQSYLNKDEDDSKLLEEIAENLLKSKDEEDLDILKDKEDHVNLQNKYKTLDKSIVNTIAVTEVKSVKEQTLFNSTISVEDNSIGKDSLDKDNLRMDNIEERRTKPKRIRRYRLLPQMDNKCAVCKKKFDFQADLWEHGKKLHPNAKTFKCRDCNKLYKYPICIRRHIKDNHKIMQNDFVCKTCSQTFSVKSKFERHLRTHSSDRPYSCLLCNISFKYECNLKTHQRIHLEADTGNCDKDFISVSKEHESKNEKEADINVNTELKSQVSGEKQTICKCDLCPNDDFNCHMKKVHAKTAVCLGEDSITLAASIDDIHEELNIDNAITDTIEFGNEYKLNKDDSKQEDPVWNHCFHFKNNKGKSANCKTCTKNIKKATEHSNQESFASNENEIITTPEGNEKIRKKFLEFIKAL